MNPRRLRFTVTGHPVIDKHGVPKAKGRPRAIAKLDSKGEPFVQMVTPQDTREAEAAIRNAFKGRFPNHRPWTGPVLLRFTAVFETPRSFNRALREAAARGTIYATRKPDKDNIEKLIVDSLNLIAFNDDAQVQGGGVKRYGSPARLEIELEPLDSPDVPPTPGQRRAERPDQPRLPLKAPERQKSNPTKPSPHAAPQGAKEPPDLSGYNARQRALIEAALARDEAARRNMKK